MAVVKYYTKLVAPRLGLCSNWLASLTPGLNIPVWIRRGSFHFPISEVSAEEGDFQNVQAPNIVRHFQDCMLY